MRIVLNLLLFGAMVALAIWFERGREQSITAADGSAVHVIDGDSLRVGGVEIRLAGIDAPEYRQTCRDGAGAEWACGKEARETLVRLVAAGGLDCRSRAEDRYGRALATCRTSAGDVGRAMVAAGFAESAGDDRFDAHPDVMAEAKAAKRGIWRGDHQHPADWRRANAG